MENKKNEEKNESKEEINKNSEKENKEEENIEDNNNKDNNKNNNIDLEPINKNLNSNRRITNEEVKECSTLILEEKDCDIFNKQIIRINASGMIGYWYSTLIFQIFINFSFNIIY